MVRSMTCSILQTGGFKPDEVICCSADDGTSEALSADTGILRANSISELLEFNPNLLILGCKPQQLDSLSLGGSAKKVDCLLLSIMAGITIERLSRTFPCVKNIIRAMPNTPGQIGEGITGYVFSATADQADQELISSVLSSLGTALALDSEDDIDKVTAISGSGPAYVFEFACALENAAIEIGMNPSLARKFAMQTIIGSARLMDTSELHPEDLRNQVTSPNGTTQAALDSFSSNNFRELILNAVKAARNRSIELSNA